MRAYYSSDLRDIFDFKTLVVMRSLQSAALAFSVVPIATVARLTLPLHMRGDGAALFSCFPRCVRFDGISAATSLPDPAQPNSSILFVRMGFAVLHLQ